ncbi:transposase [Hydrogenophaga sp.]|uniref:transposase n=1 Tax=Hydrogenophaga sp. TaxID=1904254 RepID=UPI003D0E38B5
MLFACVATDDFFRSRIDHMIALRHSPAVLGSRMPWQEIEAQVAQVFSRRGRAGVAPPGLDLFGELVQHAAVASNAGRLRVPLHIMIALLYLKHAFNESGEGVVERWGETPTWPFFSGRAYLEHRLPCDATTLIKLRQLLGEEGVEELLAQTINVAVILKLFKPQELPRAILDSTVQHKAIAHPTDSRLLETAKDAGVDLKQTFAKEGKNLGRKASRYPHTRQFKRMRRAIKRQRSIVGSLKREVERRAAPSGKLCVRRSLRL